jgi:hypothetical protein
MIDGSVTESAADEEPSQYQEETTRLNYGADS